MLGGRSPTAADVPSLRYTEWVVRESMRLYPPAWGIAREALADCEIGGLPRAQGNADLHGPVVRPPRRPLV